MFGLIGWAAGAALAVTREPSQQQQVVVGKHRARYELALCDPTGPGGWTRDCACGLRCPLQATEEAADQWLNDHLTAEAEAA